jgi:hypothetical protein
VDDAIAVVGDRLMLRENDVPMMLLRAEAALSRARRRGDSGVVFVHTEGDAEFGIAQLRKPATLTTDFFSGSGRPVVGRGIRFAKRVVRRGLRWYIGPIAEQQSQVNHALLDLVERLRTQNETLSMQVELLQGALDDQSGPSGDDDG